METVKLFIKWLLLLAVGPVVCTFCTQELGIGAPVGKDSGKAFCLGSPAPVVRETARFPVEGQDSVTTGSVRTPMSGG